MVMLSVSGSINSAKHLAAVAHEAGCDVDVYGLYERYADVIPLLTAVRPNGERTTEEFEAAGGARGVMKQLERFMKTNARTVTGHTLGENISGFKVADDDVIRPVARPLGTHPTIVMLRGSLCPETSIVKLSVTEKRNLQFRGPAVVFESALDAIDGIQRGAVKAGDVIVVRGLGPKRNAGHGHGVGRGVRGARRRSCRKSCGRHRRPALRIDQCRHYARRSRARSCRRWPDRTGRGRRHDFDRRSATPRQPRGRRNRTRAASRPRIKVGGDRRTGMACRFIEISSARSTKARSSNRSFGISQPSSTASMTSSQPEMLWSETPSRRAQPPDA